MSLVIVPADAKNICRDTESKLISSPTGSFDSTLSKISTVCYSEDRNHSYSSFLELYKDISELFALLLVCAVLRTKGTKSTRSTVHAYKHTP